MKPLAIWLAVVAVVFGAYALITAGTRDTEQVFVVVDSSFQMRPVWTAVQLELDQIDDQDHAEFALATTKQGLLHSWQSSAQLVGVDIPFGPCSFEAVDSFAEAAEADERILITTAANACDTTALVGWEIIQLGP